MTSGLPLRIRLLQPALMRVRPAPLASFIKRLTGISRIDVETPAGRLAIDPVSVMGHALLNEGTYEAGMAATVQRLLGPGSTFVDVGANEGYFTVMAARRVSAAGRVLAIEPQTRLRPVIQRNLELNHLRHVRLESVAISDEPGTAAFHLSADTNTGSSGLSRHTQYVLPTEEVRTDTLANVVAAAGLEHIDLMKMDIEGFEYEAVLGSRDLFRNGRVRALALELHPTVLKERGKDANAIIEFLHECGYRESAEAAHLLLLRA